MYHKLPYILTTVLLMVTVTISAQHTVPDMLYQQPDTLDEDDYLQRRDTVKMSRRNVALERDDRYYGIDYVIDDPYLVTNERFAKGPLENLYVSGGAGFDFLQPRTEGFETMQLSQLGIAVGKQLSPLHSLRLSLGAAMSYLTESQFLFFRGSAKLDYLYDISTRLAGYRAARPLSVSLMAGAGANLVRQNDDWAMRFVPEIHGGLQFRIYTGPRCYLNIEPYASLSTDQLDHESNLNWRHHDVSYGVNLNVQYYLFDQLSSQSRLRLLDARGDNSLMVDRETVDTWRTPWFFEAGSGPVFSRPDGVGTSIGNATSFSVGRWLSPVLGLLLGAATRSAVSLKVPAADAPSGLDELYHSHYNSGRIDFLVNPFGFSRNFSWDDQFGAYLVLGTEIGNASYHDAEGIRRVFLGQTFTAGMHLWTKLTDDLQFFVEPRFTHNTYTNHNASYAGVKKFVDNLPGVNVGLTMLIRSEKFHDLDEFDDVQNFMHSYVRGFRVGGLGGLTVLHPKTADYGAASAWNASAYLEYRFSHLHSVRLMGELLSTKDKYMGSFNTQPYTVSQNGVIASLDYQVSVTNLLSGILMNRWCELEAYVGPSAEYILSTSCSDGRPYVNKGPLWGANAGLKLSKHIWNGISLVASPTIYFINGNAPQSVNTVSLSGNHFYQTFSLGVQYKIGSVRRNATKVRQAKLASDAKWAARQQRVMEKQQKQLDRRNARLSK